MKKIKKRKSGAVRHIKKWLSVMSVALIIGGVFAFGFLAYIANVFGETKDTYDPLWMVYMIPLMIIIATPVTTIIARALYRHIDVLTEAMSAVADGKTDVQIPIEGKKAFNSVYEDFNKMAAEIAGISALRIQLVDGFSHELKTPIANINGFAKMLLTEDLTEEKRKKYLEIIVSESERLGVLSQNNLLLSKIDAQEIVTNKQSYNLGRQLQETAISMERAWSEKNITLSADLSDIQYYGNADLMASVWQNLLSNAIKFTPKNGEINIALSKENGFIKAVFADSGMGINAQALPHIFERYYQAETSHSGEGHGLGLAIAKRIITLCGGQISVESREGEGSVFTVILPE